MESKECLTKQCSAEARKRLLLHCCCAPCASYVLELLVPQYECTVFFYNPNIEPKEEHDKRKTELEKLMARNTLLNEVVVYPFITEYENDRFRNTIISISDEEEGGVRCMLCFDLRLRRTAALVVDGEYDVFATTLTVSPHKKAHVINEIGIRLADEYNIEYLISDYKKRGGYNRSVELAKKYDLYRQDYCGCQPLKCNANA